MTEPTFEPAELPPPTELPSPTELPPPDELVGRLVAIWSEVLVSGVVNAETDFVELGGTSLAAVRIRAKVRSEVGRDVTLLDLFESRTPREVAELLPAAPVWPDSD